MRNIIWLFVITFMIIVNIKPYDVKAQEQGIEKAKNSIVKIYAGMQSNTGSFRKQKSGNGFIIAKIDGRNYIVTSHDVINTNKKSEKVIKVVVRGDTTVTAQLLTESVQQDYAILVVEEGLENKEVLGIKDQSEKKGPVYVIGFDGQTGIKYEKDNVKMVEGKYDNLYEHQIKLNQDLKVAQGAAVINSKGYLVGIYRGIKNSKDSLTAQITSASELKEILKSFNISFATDQKDQIDHDFEKILKRCQKKVNGSKYKDNSKQKLESVILQINTAQSNGTLSAAQKQTYTKQLKTAEKQLKEKMTTSHKIIYALLIIIIGLILWFFRLVSQMSEFSEEKNKNYNNSEEEIKSKPTEEEKQKKIAYLEVKDIHKMLRIDKNEFYIGKKDTMDLVLNGISTISRCHALITFDGKDYYIEDQGSSNGTFVNGRELEEGKKKKLSSGDIIMLAEVTMIFEEK